MYKFNKVFIFVLFFLIHQIGYSQSIYPSYCSYRIDSPINSRKTIYNLDGDWEFYLEKTPEQIWSMLEEYSSSGKKLSENHNIHDFPADQIIKVPGFWNKKIEELTGKKQPLSRATYRLVVENLMPNSGYAITINESPATSAAIYINGKNKYICGDPYSKKDTKYRSTIKPVFIPFVSSPTGKAEIVIFVNNYFYRKGGVWDSVHLGPEKKTYSNFTFLTGYYLISMGFIMFLSILALIQFLLNHRQRQHLYIFLLGLACASRISVAGFNSLGILFPNIPAEIKIKIEYIAIWLIPAVYYMQMIFLYPDSIKKVFKVIPAKIFRYAYLILDFGLGIASLVLPASISNKLVPFMESCIVIGVIYIVVYFFTIVKNRKPYAFYHVSSIIAFSIGLVLDLILSQIKGLLPISFVPLCLVLFTIIQMAMLSKIQKDLYTKGEAMAEEVQYLNISYMRFVPYEFLKLLKKNSITNIELGDNTTVDMSILFSKILVFDVKNHVIPSPAVQYEIYCEFLRKISPPISRNNGFISKFLSSGIMALFQGTDSADAALNTALKAVKCLKELNNTYRKQGLSIAIYTGLHYGSMILGTIGTKDRLDDTVISDTVNTVARIEAVCERLNKNIIISEEIFKNTDIEKINSLDINQLQPIPIKGKKKTLKLFECEENNDYVTQNESALNQEEEIEELLELEEV